MYSSRATETDTHDACHAEHHGDPTTVSDLAETHDHHPRARSGKETSALHLEDCRDTAGAVRAAVQRERRSPRRLLKCSSCSSRMGLMSVNEELGAGDSDARMTLKPTQIQYIDKNRCYSRVAMTIASDSDGVYERCL